MQIKTFRAPTIAEALSQIKKQLGPDAIILGNKKIDINPSESIVEVMAAVEHDTTQKGEDNPIQRDIEEIKGFLSMLISSKDYFTQLQLKQPLAEVYHSLIMRGLDERQTYRLLNNVLAQIDGEVDKRQIIESFCRQLIGTFNLARPFHSMPKGDGLPPVYTFLGPTGVGKTTTLAKLAAYLKIKRRCKVGIISIDTYRIGAVDQLKTYAKILNAPLTMALNRQEFEDATRQFQNHDAILVDTIGRNFLRKEYVEDLEEVFADTEHVQHFLVLSATAKDNDLKQTIFTFNRLNLSSLVFTKIDETMDHGCLINQLIRFPYPLSYLGTGQRVPEDIELATHKRLLSLLFPSGNGLYRKESHGSGRRTP